MRPHFVNVVSSVSGNLTCCPLPGETHSRVTARAWFCCYIPCNLSVAQPRERCARAASQAGRMRARPAHRHSGQPSWRNVCGVSPITSGHTQLIPVLRSSTLICSTNSFSHCPISLILQRKIFSIQSMVAPFLHYLLSTSFYLPFVLDNLLNPRCKNRWSPPWCQNRWKLFWPPLPQLRSSTWPSWPLCSFWNGPL